MNLPTTRPVPTEVVAHGRADQSFGVQGEDARGVELSDRSREVGVSNPDGTSKASDVVSCSN